MVKLLNQPLSSFDFCSAGEDNSPSENLGQVVFGERIRASPFKVKAVPVQDSWSGMALII